MANPISASDYTNANRLAVPLPSGTEEKPSVFVIRRVPPELLPDLTRSYDERLAKEWDTLSPEERAESIKAVMNTLTRLIPAICVEPKVVASDTKVEGAVAFNDIGLNDLMELFTKCFEFSGLSEEAVDARKN